MIILSGERHKRQRQLLMPPFHGERMRHYGQQICDIALDVANKWSVDRPFFARSAMQEITMRVILQAVFGLALRAAAARAQALTCLSHGYDRFSCGAGILLVPMPHLKLQISCLK